MSKLQSLQERSCDRYAIIRELVHPYIYCMSLNIDIEKPTWMEDNKTTSIWSKQGFSISDQCSTALLGSLLYGQRTHLNQVSNNVTIYF